jgi:prepilin-type N-terminal cleavage/methylation domain-containing protein
MADTLNGCAMKAMSNIFGQRSSSLLRQEKECGFTLIELMVTMVMGLIILAGITALFISYGKTSTAVSSRTERMGDLYLAMQMMQADLRESVADSAPSPSFPADLESGGRKPVGVCNTPNNKSVSKPANYPTSFPYYPYWDAVSKTLTYQDQDGNTGIFQYQRTSNDRIYWLRPDRCVYRFEELIRDLDTTSGMTVSTASGVWTVTLNATHSDEERKRKNMSMSFKAWPRN